MIDLFLDKFFDVSLFFCNIKNNERIVLFNINNNFSRISCCSSKSSTYIKKFYIERANAK